MRRAGNVTEAGRERQGSIREGLTGHLDQVLGIRRG